MYGLPIAVLAVGFVLDWGVPGLYMDAINPEYLAHWILNGSGSARWVLPGNALFDRFPVFTGSVYHGSTQLYYALPFFLIFGIDLAAFRFVQFSIGAVIIALLVRFVSSGVRGRAGLVAGGLAGLLVALDPGFVLAMRTQAYSCIFPVSLIVGALVVLRLDVRPPPSVRRIVVAGALVGLAGFSYFIMFLFVPAIVLLIWWSYDARGRMARLRDIVWFGLGGVVGYVPFFAGVTLIGIELGGVGEAVEYLRNMSDELQVGAHDGGLVARVMSTYRSLKWSINGGWVSRMTVRSAETTAGTLRFMVGVGLLVVGTCAASLLDRRDGARRLLYAMIGLIASFVLGAIAFGDRLQGHHFSVVVPFWGAALATSCAVLGRVVRQRAMRAGDLVSGALSKAGRGALVTVGVTAGAIALSSVVAQTHLRRDLRDTGGVGLYSDAITALGVRLDDGGSEVSVLTPDWGYLMPLEFLGGDHATVHDARGDISAAVRGHACGVGAVLVVSAFPSSLDYLEIARQSRTTVIEGERWYEENGRPAFEVVRFSDPQGC